MTVLVITKTIVLDTITFLKGKYFSSSFSTRPKAMAPLIKAAYVANEIS
jgi:hypothetical protein